MTERFGTGAARMGGQAALLLGWLPEAFWVATPEEFASVLAAMQLPGGGAIDKTTLDRMMEADRGG